MKPHPDINSTFNSIKNLPVEIDYSGIEHFVMSQPATVFTLKTIFSSIDHETYISPFGPVQGTAPSVVPSSSTQLPAFLLILNALLQDSPAFVEDENSITELSFGSELPYLSN